jgi:hypothetical protein
MMTRRGNYLPEWFHARGQHGLEHGENAQRVDDNERKGQTHGQQHDAEPWTDPNQFNESKIVLLLDGVEQ